jgi:hypothetical protein
MGTWIWVIIVVIAASAASLGLYKFASSRNWVVTQGKVLSSSIEELRRTNQMLINEGASNFEYRVNVSYEYSVGGQTYSNETVSAGFPSVFESLNDAENIIAKYAVDKTIDVYYDSANHRSAALITAEGIPMGGLIAVFVMVLAIGGIIISVLKFGVLSS